jgi:hypothetical protein
VSEETYSSSDESFVDSLGWLDKNKDEEDYDDDDFTQDKEIELKNKKEKKLIPEISTIFDHKD